MSRAPKIDTDIPVPAGRGKYEFGLLDEVGKSRFYPEPNNESLQQSARQFARYNGINFVCRSREEDGVRGVRVWRVK